jgi:hypothetical protein
MEGNRAVAHLLQRDVDEDQTTASVPGESAVDLSSIVEDYPIVPGAVNHLERRIESRDEPVGEVNYVAYSDTGTRTALGDWTQLIGTPTRVLDF